MPERDVSTLRTGRTEHGWMLSRCWTTALAAGALAAPVALAQTMPPLRPQMERVESPKQLPAHIAPRRPHAQASGHRPGLVQPLKGLPHADPHANSRQADLRGRAGGRPKLVEFGPRHFIRLSVSLWQLHNSLRSRRFKRLAFFSTG